MKRSSICISTLLLCLFSAMAVHAQLKDGEIIRIKNVKSGKYAKPTNVPAGGQEVNTQVVLYTLGEDARMKWKAIAVAGGYFKFQNLATNKFLGVLNRSKEQYGFICQKNEMVPRPMNVTPINNEDLYWKLEKTATGFKLKNKNSGLLAAVEGGGANNNSKLIQWADQGQPDTEWQFETVGSGNSVATGKKVLFDVTLNYIAVSEATRNRIDNGDCKRVFGQVSTELWELDENNEMKTRLRSYNNMPEMIYNQTNHDGPPTAALSYYQDNVNAAANNQMGKVTYNIPEILLKEKKLMLVVKTYVGTRHKDNDFASYDALRMGEVVQNTYILDYRSTRSETIQTITDLAARSDQSTADMILLGHIIPSAIFARADDTHNIWVKFTCKKN